MVFSSRFLQIIILFWLLLAGVFIVLPIEQPWYAGAIWFTVSVFVFSLAFFVLTRESSASQDDDLTTWKQQVIDINPDGILVVDQSGQIILANQATHHTFGYLANELLGKKIEALIPQEHRGGHSKLQRGYMSQSPKGRLMTDREVHGVRKNGEVFPIEVKLSPPIEVDGRIYVISSVRDISVRIELEKQLRQSQKMEAIGQLTGGVAHDFNNLLGIVQGNLELAFMSIEDNDSKGTQQAIENVQKATERAEKLIKQLLAFSRKQSLDPSELSVATVVDEFLPMLQHAVGKGIEIQTRYQDNQAQVKLDLVQFENALINLVVNAKDAMAEQGLLQIEVNFKHVAENEPAIEAIKIPAGDYVVVTVKDSGVGIKAEDIERIFEPFYTNRQSGKGTGLGLAMVYGFVRQSKGYIQVNSVENQGSSFGLFFPVSGFAVDQAPTMQIKENPPVAEEFNEEFSESFNESLSRILVVDDEVDLLNVAVKFLSRGGYEVETASSGEQALEILEQQNFDVLFTDIVMPGGMNGVELVMQSQVLYPRLKFIVGTGYDASLLDIEEAAWLKKNLLFKPYKEAELLAKIDEVVQQT